MSQSDYIELIKTQNLLNNLKSTPRTLTSRDYIRFKQYAVETSVVNTLPRFNQLIPSANTLVFNMNVIVNCPRLKQNVVSLRNKGVSFSFIRCITA